MKIKKINLIPIESISQETGVKEREREIEQEEGLFKRKNNNNRAVRAEQMRRLKTMLKR